MVLKVIPVAAVVALVVGCTSCGSPGPEQQKQVRPGETDPNKHLEGSTDVLKNYRLPEGGKKAPTKPDFRTTDQKGKEKK